MEQSGEPLGARIGVIAFGLRKMQREVVGHAAVLHADLAQGDLIMCLGQLLHSIDGLYNGSWYR